MGQIGTFALQIEPATAARPMRAAIVVSGGARSEQAVLHLSSDCGTFDQLDSHINGLQDERDLLRTEARHAFTGTAGHA